MRPASLPRERKSNARVVRSALTNRHGSAPMFARQPYVAAPPSPSLLLDWRVVYVPTFWPMIRVSLFSAELPSPTFMTSPSPATANGATNRPSAMLDSSAHFPCPRRDERSLCMQKPSRGSFALGVATRPGAPGCGPHPCRLLGYPAPR